MTHTILFEALFCEQCLNVKLDVLDLAHSTGSLAQDLFGFEFLLGDLKFLLHAFELLGQRGGPSAEEAAAPAAARARALRLRTLFRLQCFDPQHQALVVHLETLDGLVFGAGDLAEGPERAEIDDLVEAAL